MAKNQRTVTKTRREASMRRPWESMSLTKIGKFEDIIRGSGTKLGDPASSGKREN